MFFENNPNREMFSFEFLHFGSTVLFMTNCNEYISLMDCVIYSCYTRNVRLAINDCVLCL